MTGCSASTDIEVLASRLRHLDGELVGHERQHAAALRRVAPAHRPSASNLLHYLALRQHDLRPLQTELARQGLSSLGRTEAHVLAGLRAVRDVVERLAGGAVPSDPSDAPVSFNEGESRIEENARALLGSARPDRAVRVMVTLPSEAAHDVGLVRDLVAAGMDVARINSAHDGLEAWRAMAGRVRAASRDLGRECRILFDLAGPKLRTGAFATGDEVVHWRPRRDHRGRAVAPSRVRVLGAARGLDGGESAGASAVVTLDPALVAAALPGDRLRLFDLRGRAPELHVVGCAPGQLETEGWQGAYVESGARAELWRGTERLAEGRLGSLPPVIALPRVRRGELLFVTPEHVMGRAERRDAGGCVVEPAAVACTLPEVFRDVRPGERVWIDDGRIGGVVESAALDGLRVRVDHASLRGTRIRSDKGINLPDTRLALPALTAADRTALDAVAGDVDLVGLSFVRTSADVDLLVSELERRGAEHLGVILKIETRQGFENLPALLLEALRRERVGVMVARGDLAVEIGFGRLAEVQEEILWLAEAAHVPVVWATQVLEGLAKKGLPSRAEVTDAAMAGRAECVMLNKGPHVVDAVRFLDDVLHRMQAHQHKKRAMLRHLAVSHLAP